MQSNIGRHKHIKKLKQKQIRLRKRKKIVKQKQIRLTKRKKIVKQKQISLEREGTEKQWQKEPEAGRDRWMKTDCQTDRQTDECNRDEPTRKASCQKTR